MQGTFLPRTFLPGYHYVNVKQLANDVYLRLGLGLALGLVSFLTFKHSWQKGMSGRGNIQGRGISYIRFKYIPSQIDRLNNSDDAKNN